MAAMLSHHCTLPPVSQSCLNESYCGSARVIDTPALLHQYGADRGLLRPGERFLEYLANAGPVVSSMERKEIEIHFGCNTCLLLQNYETH